MPCFAIQRLGEDARQRGLADSASAGEQEGVMDALIVEGVDQRGHHVFLAGYFIECLRTPLAGERLVTHWLRMRLGMLFFGWQVVVISGKFDPLIPYRWITRRTARRNR